MEALFSYLSNLWMVITNALIFNPQILDHVHAQSFSVTLGVAIVGGASLLLGQSAVLFANRVKPLWFLLSLFLNGLTYTVGLLVWATMTWLIGTWLLVEDISLWTTISIIFLTAAPMAFAFLGLMPYLGTGVLRLLSVWSYLLAVWVIDQKFQATLVMALTITSLGWVLMLLLAHTVGRPVLALRNWLWKTLVGTSPDTAVEEIIMKVLQQHGYKSDAESEERRD